MRILQLFPVFVYAMQYDCNFRLLDGKTVDLSGLYSPMPDYIFQAEDYRYIFNVCNDIQQTCSINPGAIASQYTTIGGCVSVIARNSPIPPSADYLIPNAPDAGIRLIYSNGDMCNGQPRQTVFNLKCSKSAKQPNIINVSEFPTCVYNIDLETSASCPQQKPKTPNNPPPNSGSGKNWSLGMMFLMGLLIVITAYCALGIFLNKRKDPELPIYESIPHKDTWQNLPALVKTGVLYSYERSVDLIDKIRGR